MDLFPNPLIVPVGIMIGVLITAPVGPVNVLCLQRAVERGFWGGVAAGLGAVLGDGLIALLAALGVGTVSGVVRHYRLAVQVIGGLALLGFGIHLYRTRPRLRPPPSASAQPATLRDYAWDIPQTFFLTISNPGAVLGLFAIFGGVSSFVEVRSAADAVFMVAAIMAGSLGWWIVISHIISRIRDRIDLGRLQLINRVAGLVLFGFGVALLGEVAIKWSEWF